MTSYGPFRPHCPARDPARMTVAGTEPPAEPSAEPRSGVVPRRTTHLPCPTRSAALLLLLAVILELLGRLINSTGVTIAAAAALGAVLGDAALMPRMDRLGLSRELPARITAGIPTTVQLRIKAPAGRHGARRPVILIDRHPALPVARIVTPPLRAGGHAIATRDAVAAERGYWAGGGEVAAEAYSPLGGFVSRRPVRVGGPCWVHPAPAQPFRLPVAERGRVQGSAPSRRSGPGTEFFGIREWRSGDAATAVHWRASARRGQLLVVERELPAHNSLLVIAGPAPDGVTAQRAEPGPDQTMAVQAWETAIARTAATAVAARRDGFTVTLINGPDPVTPRSPRDLLDWFAELGQPPIPTVAAVKNGLQLTGLGATVLWLAGPAPTEAMAALVRPGAIVHCLAPTAVGGH
jgi:uncharacterized protein (DUF58 family)